MPYNPLAWWGAFRIVRWALWRAPRGLYHLALPRAYDTWKVRHEWRAAWKEHRRHCRPCWPEHRAGVLASVEDSLIDDGIVRHRLTRLPDEIITRPRKDSLPRPSS